MNVYMQKLLIVGLIGQIEIVVDLFDVVCEGVVVLCGIVFVVYLYLLFGGMMDNKVVQMFVCMFVQLNYVVYWLNFCGVGVIEGVYDNGMGEVDDFFVVFVYMCVQFVYVDLLFVFVGFLFGIFVLLYVVKWLCDVGEMIEWMVFVGMVVSCW